MPIHEHTTYKAECCFCAKRELRPSSSYPGDWHLVTTVSFEADGRYSDPTEFAACPECNDRIFQPAREARRFK